MSEHTNELKELIGLELDDCNQSDTPYICANLGDDESRDSLIDSIYSICIERNMVVQEAIFEFEKRFNPNMMD